MTDEPFNLEQMWLIALIEARQLRGYGGLFDKDEPVRFIAHLGLTKMDPCVASVTDFGRCALCRHQGFF